MKTKALVVLSGGQDSTTCLAWAIAQGYECHCITFDYGQKHKVEIGSAAMIAGMLNAESWDVIELGDGILAGSSPLVNKGEELEQYADHQSLPGGLEKTFVPMRNQLFLTVAANRAYVMGCNVLVTGVCQEDSGGYPDCRATFISALQDAINYGTFTGEKGTLPPMNILTPLMYMSKAKSVHLAQSLPGCMEALAFSHTSYDGNYPPTGKDHATLLRAKGFEEAGVPDPLIVRAWNEGFMDLPNTPNYMQCRIEGYSGPGMLPKLFGKAFQELVENNKDAVWLKAAEEARKDGFVDRPVERTATKHVWRDTVTGKFHYSDGAEQIDPTPYDTEAQACSALDVYASFLNGTSGPTES